MLLLTLLDLAGSLSKEKLVKRDRYRNSTQNTPQNTIITSLAVRSIVLAHSNDENGFKRDRKAAKQVVEVTLWNSTEQSSA